MKSDPVEKSGKSEGKRIGRPPEPVPEAMAQRVLAWLRDNKSLKSFCEQEGTPTRWTIHEWRHKDPEFASQFARAREIGNEVMEDEQLALADLQPRDQVEVAWRKLQIDTRQKILANRDPARYGTKAHLEHSGGVSVQVVTGVPDESP